MNDFLYKLYSDGGAVPPISTKVMKKLLLIFVIVIAIVNPSSKLENDYLKMTINQKIILDRSYQLGKEFNFGYTLSAIAWKESNAGEWLVNIQDPSFGVFHNHINSVMSRHPEIEDTPFNRNRVASMLIGDIEFSGAESIAELEFWEGIHGDANWMKIWASYNGGWIGNPSYAREIKARIIILKKYMEDNE